MYVYCIFCRTNRISAVKAFLEATTPHRYMQPRIVQRKWVKGEEQRVEHDFLQGYLFVFAETPITDRTPFYRVDGFLRFLGAVDNETGRQVNELHGGDRAFAEALLNENGLIDNVKVYREGDLLTPASGLLANMEGRILKVDRHRQRLLMSYRFDDQERTVWVGYDVLAQGAQPPGP